MLFTGLSIITHLVLPAGNVDGGYPCKASSESRSILQDDRSFLTNSVFPDPGVRSQL